jgi:phosphoinositide-3-kinase, regulatory subunit 4
MLTNAPAQPALVAPSPPGPVLAVAHSLGGAVSAPPRPPPRYDAEVAAVRAGVERVVLELLTGPRASGDTQRALLGQVGRLGHVFGRRDISDVLLPLLITCLNAGEWALRSAFFDAVAAIGPHTGRHSLDVFLLPCLEQALVDGQTAVVCDAVRCLAATAGCLRRRSLLAAARKAVPLLQHPSAAVRHSAVHFVAAAARCLPPADAYAQLGPLVRAHTHTPPLALDGVFYSFVGRSPPCC